MGQNWKKGGQRYKAGRVGSMVSPGSTGFLFTIDPFQVGKSIKETQALLDVHSKDLVPPQKESIVVEETEALKPKDGALSSLLMEELAEVRKPENVENGGERKKKPFVPRKGVRPLETNCKGYTFFAIPSAASNVIEEARDDEHQDEELEQDGTENNDPDELDTKKKRSESNTEDCIAANDAQKSKDDAEDVSVDTFRPNTNVTKVANRIWDDLLAAPKPVVRFTHRMMPVQISCFPTKKFIVPACKCLCNSLKIPEGRSAIKLGITLKVRNNSNVDKEQANIRRAIEAALPMNRFLILNNSSSVQLDAMLNVFVMHSTACIGIAERFSECREFNLHEISKEALSSSVESRVTKEHTEVKQTPDQEDE